MAKKIRDSRIDSRTARAKLKPSGNPYWRSLGPDLHLGYRKNKQGGVWVLRRYLGNQNYATETIAHADDVADADGVNVLTFHQAQDRARERMKVIAEEARIASLGPVITVRSAVDAYYLVREARERARAAIWSDAEPKGIKRDTRSRLKHVPEELLEKPLVALTHIDLAEWRRGLRVSAPQRVVSDFKAALNAGLTGIREPSQRQSIRDAIKEGLKTVNAAPASAREAQVLPDADVRRVIAAAWEVDADGGWEGALARIVLVLAATGARFGQAVRMTVADVQTANSRLMVPTSRKGRGEKQRTHIGVRVGPDVIEALKPALAGRKGHEPLLTRPHWRQTSPARWEKTAERGPWFTADEMTPPWAKVVARAALAAGTVPYALRHSSIVRGLRAGLPVRLVAALHDTSSAMIELHYAAYIVDAMDELAARAVVPLTTAAATVTPIQQAR